MVSSISGSISVDGLISGLNTSGIIDQLISIQTRRISIFEDRQLVETEKISVFQQLQGLFLGVRTAAGALRSPGLYTNRSVRTSNSDILSVTATSDAAEGATTITVQQLAAKNQFVSNRFADADISTAVTGDLEITVGDGADAITTTITLSSQNNSFNEIRNTINNSGAKVKATIIKVDDSDSPLRLVIDALESGTEGAFTLSFANASFLTTETDEAAGAGAGTDTASTDDNDDSTFAFTTARPNLGTSPTVKLDGVTIEENLATPTISSVANADTGGTLTDNTIYYYRVAALDASGETVGTQTVAITTGDSQGGGDAQVNTITVDNVANAVSYQLYFSLDPDFSNSGLALVGGTPIADSSGGAGTGTTNLVHSDAGDGGSFTPGTPLTTATQGYTIDFDTGTVKFNDDQAEAVTLTYQHGGLIFEETQTAQDAIIEFGEGANALTIKKSSNEFSDVIEGVTISLKKVDTDTPVIINVKRDIFGIKTGVQNFVNALNETNAFIAEQTFFNVDTETTGLLFSDSNLFNIRSRVSSILGTAVGSVTPGNIRSLGEIGIRISAETGTFLLDNQVLSKALSDDPDQVRDLLAELGRAEDPDIKVTTFGDNAVTSSALGYAVNITQAAERAEVEGNVDVSAGIIANETLIISREGTSVTISLTIGQTAQEAVSAINSDLLNLGISNVVAVLSTATGKITIRHESFGSKFSFTVQSSLAGTSGTGLGATVADGERTFTGEDVAGTINGEAATGIGQFLTGDTGNSTTDSLQLQVTLSAAALTSQGSGQGQVVVSRGIAAQLEVFLKFLTDETQEGPIQSAIEQANGRISDLQASIDSFTERAQKEREKLVREFARLEQALGSLQTQSTFLEVQLNSIAAISNAIIARRPRR